MHISRGRAEKFENVGTSQREVIRQIALGPPENQGVPTLTWTFERLASHLVESNVIDAITDRALADLLLEDGVSLLDLGGQTQHTLSSKSGVFCIRLGRDAQTQLLVRELPNGGSEDFLDLLRRLHGHGFDIIKIQPRSRAEPHPVDVWFAPAAAA